MKVKKFLTLLILSTLLAGCNLAPANNNKSSKASSDAGDVSSTDSGENSGSGDSSGGDQAALVSISVTAPTKVAYTIGEEFSSAGLVVTATMSDGTTQTVSSGYEVSNPDMTTAGTKAVTVTYQGKTASFDITVAKPTAWSATERANFEAVCYGYVPTYFYGPDYGVGDLAWALSTDGSAVYAIGDAVAAPAQGEDYAFKGIADLLVADGFVVSSEPDAEKENYSYALLKSVTVENETRCIRARLTAVDSEGKFAASGIFYMDFSDSFFYSWEETGYNAVLKTAFNTEDDFPALPDGLYDQDFAGYVALYVQYFGYCPVEVLGLGKDFDESTFMANFANDKWDYAKASLADEDNNYIAASKDGKLRIEIALDKDAGAATFTFRRQSAIAPMAQIVAGQMGLKAFAFEAAKSGAYSYYFEVTPNDGETLPQLRDRYANLLTKDDAEYKFALAISSDEEGKVKGDYVYEAPAESELPNIRVTLYADIDEGKEGAEDDVTYIGIVIREYTPFSDDLKNYATVLGFDPFDLLVDDKSGEYFIDIDIDEELTVDQMVARYTALLDADTALDAPVVGAVKVTDATTKVDAEGVGYKYLSYANDTTLVMIYAAVKKDAETGEITRLVELIFQDYNQAPESAWVDSLSAALVAATGSGLSWENTEGCFYLGGPIYPEMPDGQSYQTIASSYAGLLMTADDQLELLSAVSGSGYYILTMFSTDGYVQIQCFQNSATDYVRLAIMVYLFAHPEYDTIVNGIGAAMTVNLVKVSEGIYGALSENVNVGLSLADYGETIAKGYSEGKYLLAAGGLEFSFVAAQSGMDGNNYVATFANPDGYVVEIIFAGDENKMLEGTVLIYVYEPAPAGSGEGSGEGSGQGE